MKRIKLLFLTQDFSQYLDRMGYYLWNELEKQTDLLLWHEHGDIHEILHQFEHRPDFILIHEDFFPYISGLSSVDIPVGLYWWDLHLAMEEFREKILDKNIKYIFSVYRDKFHEWYPDLSDRMYWLPLFVNPAIFKDYGQPKEIDWLMMGKVDPEVYPLRAKMLKVMKNKPGFVYHEHPGYRNIEDEEYNQVFVGERFAKEINRAKMFLTCSSIFDYPVGKYFEVPACKTLLLAPAVPELEDLGFIAGKHYVAVDRHDFAEKAQYYLEHPDEREAIAKQGYRLVHARHTAAQRAIELVKSIEKILRKEKKS